MICKTFAEIIIPVKIGLGSKVNWPNGEARGESKPLCDWWYKEVSWKNPLFRISGKNTYYSVTIIRKDLS